MESLVLRESSLKSRQWVDTHPPLSRPLRALMGGGSRHTLVTQREEPGQHQWGLMKWADLYSALTPQEATVQGPGLIVMEIWEQMLDGQCQFHLDLRM